MKNKISLISLLLLMLVIIIVLVSCIGDKDVHDIVITDGLKLEYELGEEPDFSLVLATVYYNDDTFINVGYDSLVFSEIDTMTPGSKILTISYDGFTIYKTVKVNDAEYTPDTMAVVKVSLPDALANFVASRDGFINKSNGYVVGDDNVFLFPLKILAMSPENIPVLVTSYTSYSEVYLEYSEFPLEGEELLKYVTIDETKHSFDFTEEAIGKTFEITTRPLDISDDKISKFTKRFTVTVVDGYNIYEAYELNYITNNSNGFSFSSVDASETRNQLQIVDDFLASEKNAVRPKDIASVILHNHLTIMPTDIPREFFLDKNRNNALYDIISIYNHTTTAAVPNFSIHGNYFSVFVYNLPNVIANGGNQDDGISNADLFSFIGPLALDKNYDHTQYSTTINNLYIADDNSTSSDGNKTEDSMLGLNCVTTSAQVMNFNNVKIEALLTSVIAHDDYLTINVTESKFMNSWHNHITLFSTNPTQSDSDEPLDKSLYPRLMLNVEKSIITKSGGPAIISMTSSPLANKNKNSGAEIYISDDSLVESWVTGTEPWFSAIDVGISMDFVLQNLIYPLDASLNKYNSSFLTERTITGETLTRRYFNIVLVNLILPDTSNGFGDIFQQLQGKTDIDGKFTIGDKEIFDMDDYVYDGKSYNFKNPVLSTVKENSSISNLILHTPSGGVAHTSAGDSLKIDTGSIAASKTNDYLTVFYLPMAFVLGNYHTTN